MAVSRVCEFIMISLMAFFNDNQDTHRKFQEKWLQGDISIKRDVNVFISWNVITLRFDVTSAVTYAIVSSHVCGKRLSTGTYFSFLFYYKIAFRREMSGNKIWTFPRVEIVLTRTRSPNLSIRVILGLDFFFLEIIENTCLSTFLSRRGRRLPLQVDENQKKSQKPMEWMKQKSKRIL